MVPRLSSAVLLPGSLKRLRQPAVPVNDRFRLRPWHGRDVPIVIEAFTDPDIQRWHRRSLELGEARQLIREWRSMWERETGASWAIERLADHAAVGRVALHHVNFEAACGEVSYWVLPHARRAGAASSAARAASEWSFDVMGLHRIELRHSVFNAASCGVATRAGFQLEGTLRSALLHVDGWHDMHVHARIRSDHAQPGG
jgi:RimJ/RimL family protein N-acetyltransferase